MEKPRRKRIYYIPGIISLTILPFAFYFFAKKEIRTSTIMAIPILWADTAFMNRQDVVFSNFKGDFPPKRNYTDILFTGSDHEDKIKLEFAQVRTKEILSTGDTSNGLHFIYSDKSSYGTFVQTLDKLRFEGAKTYMPSDNNLWFYNLPPDTVKPFQFNCLLCNDVIIIKPKISWWTETKERFIHIWHTSWQLIILFGCFVVSTLVLRRKNNGS